MVGETVTALGRDHDQAARLYDLEGGRHPLYGLVKVLVEREAGIGRHHHVEAVRYNLHGHLARLRCGSTVHSEKFASKGSHNLVTAIEHHVASEMDPGGPGDRPDVVVNRVALDHPPGGQGATDPPRVMEDQGRLEARQPGSDELRAAGKTGEEMGLDEAGSYAYVGVDPLPVQLDGHPVTHRPQVDEVGRVASVVVHYAHFGEKFRAEHSLQLGRRVATVGAGGHQHNDVVQVDCPGDLLQDRR